MTAVNSIGPTTLASRSVLDPATSQRVFRSLLAALSEPGRVVPLDGPTGIPAHLLPLLALANQDLPVAVVDRDGLGGRLVADATGAELVGLADARLVAVAAPVDARVLEHLSAGSHEEPERAALVILAAAALSDRHVGPTSFWLSGPGVPGQRRISVDGVPAGAFDLLAQRNRDHPCGLDVLLVAGDGVVGLPRTCRIERAGGD